MILYLLIPKNMWDDEKDYFAKTSTRLNDGIISEIEKLKHYYEIDGDRGRVIGYNRALVGLRSYDKEIVDVK